jgi:hypothetical protein
MKNKSRRNRSNSALGQEKILDFSIEMRPQHAVTTHYRRLQKIACPPAQAAMGSGL